MPAVTAREIAGFVGGEYTGDPELTITAVKPLAEAGEGELTFLSNPKYESLLAATQASLVLVPPATPSQDSRWIRVAEPYVALARVLQKWFSAVPAAEGISPLANIDPSAQIGEGARIGAFATISAGVVIGAGATIMNGAYIGHDSSVGEKTWIYPNVTVYHGSIIGRRCIVHSGAVIGSDGYGFATHQGTHHKIPQVGIVRIGDDVEIGAGTTIDRAALGETRIGDGTKIDNLVQIGHNVRVGKRCLIVSQVGVSGSTEIGDDSVFAGQVGILGHLKLGPRLQVAARSVVTKDWDGGITIAGWPARPMREYQRGEVFTRRLSELFERVKKLETAASDRPKE